MFIMFLLHWHKLESLLSLVPGLFGPSSHGGQWSLSHVTAAGTWPGPAALLAVTHLPTEQELQCQCAFPNASWLLCAEQHWPGAAWGDGVRPVPAVPGERLGHQLQVPRLQVFEGCTEVSRVGSWAVTAVRAVGGSGLENSILSLVPEPRSWCSIQVCYLKGWRSVLKVNCGICCDAACSKNLSGSP